MRRIIIAGVLMAAAVAAAPAPTAQNTTPRQPQAPAPTADPYANNAAAGTTKWPWPEIGVKDVVSDPESGSKLVTLTPEQAAKVTTVPTGGVAGIEIAGPDKKAYQLSIRVVLPDDEVDAPAR